MKVSRLILILPIVLIMSTTRILSGDFAVDTIYLSGSVSNRINFVFLSDGYQQNELTKYITDVKNSSDYFFKVVPFSNYKNYFNIFAIKVPSKESGASHPRTAYDCPDSNSHPRSKVNNYFGSAFDGNQIHRALYVAKSDSVYQVLKRNFPDYDQAFVLVNTPYYGGTGGTFPTSSTVSSANEIVAHEFAHSFAKVSDEYGGNCTYKSIIGPNITQAKKYELIPWNKWIDKSTPVPTPENSQYQRTPGLFMGAFYCDTGWYRPQALCKMRTLGPPYCVVCTQTIIEKIHSLVNPIDEYNPKNLNLTISDTTLNFNVKLVKTQPNTLSIQWQLNNVVTSNKEAFTLNTNQIPEGVSILAVSINDTTSLSRDTNHVNKNVHQKSIQWNINKTTTDIKISGHEINPDLNIFPNPTDNNVSIKIDYELGSSIIQVFDINGREMMKEELSNTKGFNLFIPSLYYKPGTYLVRLSNGNYNITRKFIKN